MGWKNLGEKPVAIHRGEPPAAFESERIGWIPLAEVPGLIARGEIRSAVTAAAVMLLRHDRPGAG